MKTVVAVNPTSMSFVTDVSAADVVVLKSRADVEKFETKDLLALFNSRRPTPLKKFESRVIGIERVLKMIAEDTAIHLPVAATQTEAKTVTVTATQTAAKAVAATVKPAGKPKTEKSIPVGQPDTTPAPEKKARVRVDGEPAVDRIIAYGREVGTFSLVDAENVLGIKATCMRTHMSFINSNGERFGNVKFFGDRKTKTYTFKLPVTPKLAPKKSHA